MELSDRLIALLDGNGVHYNLIEHPPLSADGASVMAAKLRGTPLEMGGKALLLKVDGEYNLVAFSAARRMHSNRFRRSLKASRLRFATTEELLETTGLVPGCVPPFGEPVLPFPLHADRSLLENERIAFTPGRLDRSIVMATADWQRLARPRLGDFTEEP